MKKVTTLFLTFVLSATVFAGFHIDPKGLPAKVLSFVKENFPAETIVYAEQDFNEFEVYLSNGVEIDFTGAGVWKQIDGNNYIALPEKVIPANILKSIKASYPGANIVKIEKEYAGYEIKLNNRMEIYVDNSGKIFMTKYDD